MLLPQPVLTTADRLDRLAPLTAPGNPFRLVATEVQALVHLERNDRDAARAAFQTLLSDAEASPAQTSRAEQMLQILGGAPEAL